MRIKSRKELISYCLKKLGDPVIEINVATEQIQDRVDEALQIIQERHFDFSTRTYLCYKLTEKDIKNKYILLDNTHGEIQAILKVYIDSTQHIDSIFNINYHLNFNVAFSGMGSLSNISYYVMKKQHLRLLDEVFSTTEHIPIRWEKYTDKLFIDINWSEILNVKDKMIFIECFKLLDVENTPQLWDDITLKRYATALIKKQWGENLSKFNLPLPGDAELNTERLISESQEEIEKLDEELNTKYQFPLDFLVG